ncbi:hypothetical protein [Streptomyces sp. NPDC101132]|uniref:hypothetical protein n=1 Tax=Streptomyces sp. NPDC101132 TaxID=3366110 RepID=UPI0038270F98
MKRIRLALVTTAAALFTLTPALTAAGAPAAAPPSGSYVQDPAGDKMRQEWSEDGRRRLDGQFRLHSGLQMAKKQKPGPKGAPEWGGQVGDPATARYEPAFEFAYEVHSAAVLRKSVLAGKSGTHDVTLRAVLRDARGGLVAEFEEAKAGRHHTLRTTHPTGKRVACDTGVYTAEWSISRTGPDAQTVTVAGRVTWDSSCEQLRKSLG